MTARSRARAGAILMAALLVLYLVFVLNYALVLIGIDEPIAKVLGVALLVMPFLGAGVLAADIIFVLRGERLLAVLRAEGGLPVDDLPKLPSGRPDPEAADAQFPRFQAEVQEQPQSWRAWLRLGLAYDASGDRRRARWATRQAIALHKTAP